MKKQLTIDNFLRRLRRRKYLGWYLYGRCIECKISNKTQCPITCLDPDRTDLWDWRKSADRLGIPQDLAKRIVSASGGSYWPWKTENKIRTKLRKRILKAVGLEGKKSEKLS